MTRFVLSLALFAAACGPSQSTENEAGSSAAISSQYVDGTVLADGILKVANVEPLATLESGAGLTTAVSQTIVEHRPYWDIEALEQYVGSADLSRLHAYANKQGWNTTPTTDPYNTGYCSGPAMTKAQALARFSAGSNVTTLGSVTNIARSRTCTTTSCTAWAVMSYDTSLSLQLDNEDNLDVDVSLVTDPNSSPFACGDLANLSCGLPAESNLDEQYTTLTNDCFRFEAVYRSPTSANNGSYAEYERVWAFDF